ADRLKNPVVQLLGHVTHPEKERDETRILLEPEQVLSAREIPVNEDVPDALDALPELLHLPGNGFHHGTSSVGQIVEEVSDLTHQGAKQRVDILKQCSADTPQDRQ